MADTSLPKKFAYLEQYVEEWSIRGEEGRYLKRHNSTLEELTSYFNTIEPLLADISAYLDQYSLKDLPEDCERLLGLALMCQECFSSVVLFKYSHVPDVLPWHRFKVSSSIIDAVKKTPAQKQISP